MFLLPLLNDSLIRKIHHQFYQLDKILDDHYCLVYVKADSIICACFTFNELNKFSFCHINFSAVSSNLLIDLISQHKSLSKVISMNHALYIGKEIYKAELSNVFLQSYIQS